jgi:hypothetical protein
MVLLWKMADNADSVVSLTLRSNFSTAVPLIRAVASVEDRCSTGSSKDSRPGFASTIAITSGRQDEGSVKGKRENERCFK